MDLLLPTPNPVATNLMGSDFVHIPELETGKLSGPSSPPLLVEETENEGFSSPSVLPPPPPLTPAPPIPMDEVIQQPQEMAMMSSAAMAVGPMLPMDGKCVGEVDAVTNELQPGLEPVLPSANASVATVASGPPQIMTRKRSSMSAVSSAMLFGTSSSSGNIGTNMCTSVPAQAHSPVEVLSTETSPVEGVPTAQPAQPPKKKKKYTPKPKKSPEVAANGTVPTLTGGVNGGASKPPSKSKSKKVAEPGTETTQSGSGTEPATKPAKPKKASKPKASKPRPPASGSSKSKSKKAKPVTSGNATEMPEDNADCGTCSAGFQHHPVVPPLKIQMPKLTRMPMPGLTGAQQTMMPLLKTVGTKEEPQDWEDNGDQGDPMMLGEMMEDGSDELGNGKGGSRKKKSKGRNGNIYIGVFNRIEWMKLQNEFGFGSVNNFGTFVLQTMRRVYGDIQFWCDVAVASGFYPELDHYKWNNGFPHAVNKEGQCFTPEPDIKMTEEKREEVVEMAKGMWEQRLQKLKQEQQQLIGVEEEVALMDGAAEDGDEDEEEDDDAMPGLENYLENMATGKYSPMKATDETDSIGAQQPSGGSAVLSDEEVNRIWNEQMADKGIMEKYGKLFNFINGISKIGNKKQEGAENENNIVEKADPDFEKAGIFTGTNKVDGKEVNG